MHQKVFLDPFLILVNNLKQPLHARNSFKNKIIGKRIIKNPYEKQKGIRTRDQSFFRLQNNLWKIPLLVMLPWFSVKKFHIC